MHFSFNIKNKISSSFPSFSFSFFSSFDSPKLTRSFHICNSLRASSHFPRKEELQTKTFPLSHMKIALCQNLVYSDKSKNLQVAEETIKESVKRGASIVVLPEMWNCPYSNDSFGPYSEILGEIGSNPSESKQNKQENENENEKENNSNSSALLSALAKENKIYIVGGSIPEKSNGKLYNTSLVFNKQGTIIAKHRKVHLFDIDIPGKIKFKESETLTAGKEFSYFKTEEYGNIGLGICYDIRFPEYAWVLTNHANCNIIIYPGAFNTTTGPAHWELLQRARAVDNQIFVVSCSPARLPGASYQAWGHSTVVSPWGEVIATSGHDADIVIAELNLSSIQEIRNNIPVRKQKRTDLYQLTSTLSPNSHAQ